MGGDGKTSKNWLENDKARIALGHQGYTAVDPKLADAMRKYSKGEGSVTSLIEGLGQDRQKELADATAKGDWTKVETLNRDAEQDRFRAHEFATDPLTGTKFATEQVQDNPLLSGVFGKGGMQERMLSEEQNLASRGWSMQPEDNEAYGQASDEIARLTAQEEGGIAQALASRGLAAAPSGAAGVAYSGLQGNKFERLAASQRKIADDRMKMNRERLNDVRNLSLETTRMGEQAVGNQFERNRQGANDYQNTLQNAVKAAQIKQQQADTEFQQREQTRGPSFGEVLGGVATAGLGAATGGLGTAIGTGLGSSLFPKGAKMAPTADFDESYGLDPNYRKK